MLNPCQAAAAAALSVEHGRNHQEIIEKSHLNRMGSNYSGELGWWWHLTETTTARGGQNANKKVGVHPQQGFINWFLGMIYCST